MVHPVSSNSLSSVAPSTHLGKGQKTTGLLGQRIRAMVEHRSGLLQVIVKAEETDIYGKRAQKRLEADDCGLSRVAANSVRPAVGWIGSRLSSPVHVNHSQGTNVGRDPLAVIAARTTTVESWNATRKRAITNGVSTARTPSLAAPNLLPIEGCHGATKTL